MAHASTATYTSRTSEDFVTTIICTYMMYFAMMYLNVLIKHISISESKTNMYAHNFNTPFSFMFCGPVIGVTGAATSIEDTESMDVETTEGAGVAGLPTVYIFTVPAAILSSMASMSSHSQTSMTVWSARNFSAARSSQCKMLSTSRKRRSYCKTPLSGGGCKCGSEVVARRITTMSLWSATSCCAIAIAIIRNLSLEQVAIRQSQLIQSPHQNLRIHLNIIIHNRKRVWSLDDIVNKPYKCRDCLHVSRPKTLVAQCKRYICIYIYMHTYVYIYLFCFWSTYTYIWSYMYNRNNSASSCCASTIASIRNWSLQQVAIRQRQLIQNQRQNLRIHLNIMILKRKKCD